MVVLGCCVFFSRLLSYHSAIWRQSLSLVIQTDDQEVRADVGEDGRRPGTTRRQDNWIANLRQCIRIELNNQTRRALGRPCVEHAVRIKGQGRDKGAVAVAQVDSIHQGEVGQPDLRNPGRISHAAEVCMGAIDSAGGNHIVAKVKHERALLGPGSRIHLDDLSSVWGGKDVNEHLRPLARPKETHLFSYLRG